jgi:hypothetical protein
MAWTAAGDRVAAGDGQPGRQFLFVDHFNRASPCDLTLAGYTGEWDRPAVFHVKHTKHRRVGA